MRKLAIPPDSASDVFLTCISIVQDANLKANLTAVEPIIASAATDYANAATTETLHLLPPQADVGGIVTTEQMSDVYTFRMVRKNTPGRPIYDRLMTAPAHGRCPLCAQRTVATLDHHLPKTHYPSLAVTPTNLVPSCADCNKIKLAITPNTAQEQTLHPYFDDIENAQWLHASILEVGPAALQFFVQGPAGCSALRLARVQHHFSIFKLANLYASHAAEELINIRYGLDIIFKETGMVGVSAHLLAQAATYAAANVNSWQTAMYKALAASNWFCNGGFRL